MDWSIASKISGGGILRATGGNMSKFLVLWSLDTARIGAEAVRAVMAMPKYAEKLIADGKVVQRYHIVGKHGGAWIYEVQSNEELDRLLALAPVYNLANYDVIPLAEMTDPANVLRTD
jgi:muconolactone delta-isomerase